MKEKYLRLALYCLQILYLETAFAQEIEEELETAAEFWESTVEQEEDLAELDTYTVYENIAYLLEHPLSINNCTAEELSQIPFINAWQIRQFITYRSLLGNFISVYELQAVPGWNIALVRKALPYFKMLSGKQTSMKERWKKGKHSIVSAGQINHPLAKGFLSTDSSAAAFAGSPFKWQWRYKYQYLNLLKWGILLEKDAGEPFIYNKSFAGFASYHIQVANWGKITQLNVGDFTVNQGQGLIQWQSFVLGSTALGFVKHAPHVKAYTAAGEFQFNRGVAFTMQRNNWRGFIYGSRKKLAARKEVSFDGTQAITSFNMSGLFRTETELSRKNNTKLYSGGGTVGFRNHQWQIDFNLSYQQLEQPVQEKEELYQVFALTGSKFLATSVSWGFNSDQGYWMGELARDHTGQCAFLTGMLAVPHPSVECGILIRFYPREFQTWNGNAYGVSSKSTNEKGLYLIGKWTPNKYFHLEASVDKRYHDWLKYRVSAPSQGSTLMLKLTGKIDKKTEWSVLYRFQDKAADINLNEQNLNSASSMMANTHHDLSISHDLPIVNDPSILNNLYPSNYIIIAKEPEYLKRPVNIYYHSVRAAISGPVLPALNFRSRMEFIIAKEAGHPLYNSGAVFGSVDYFPKVETAGDYITASSNNERRGKRTLGSLWFMELRYMPKNTSWVIDGRIQYYHTDNYDVRIYAMERDLPTYNAMPSFYGSGWRLYGMVRYRINKSYSLWLKIAGNLKPESSSLGTGYNAIVGSRNTEIRLQTQILF